MKITHSKLPGVVMIEPAVFPDDRGSFLELWNERGFAAKGFHLRFVQDNLSVSRRGVLRGLHFQYPHAQAKLVAAVYGEIFDVAVDIRKDSPTFGRWDSFVLSSSNRRHLFVPGGFAHGFSVLSDWATVLYKTTDFYCPQDEATLLWNDPALGIDWPITDLVISEKDRCGIPLNEFPDDKLPRMV